MSSQPEVPDSDFYNIFYSEKSKTFLVMKAKILNFVYKYILSNLLYVEDADGSDCLMQLF